VERSNEYTDARVILLRRRRWAIITLSRQLARLPRSLPLSATGLSATARTGWAKVDNTDAVASVFGRAGAITATNGDYTASNITNVPAGGIAATDVQAALNEIDGEKLSQGIEISPTSFLLRRREPILTWQRSNAERHLLSESFE